MITALNENGRIHIQQIDSDTRNQFGASFFINTRTLNNLVSVKSSAAQAIAGCHICAAKFALGTVIDQPI